MALPRLGPPVLRVDSESRRGPLRTRPARPPHARRPRAGLPPPHTRQPRGLGLSPGDALRARGRRCSRRSAAGPGALPPARRPGPRGGGGRAAGLVSRESTRGHRALRARTFHKRNLPRGRSLGAPEPAGELSLNLHAAPAAGSARELGGRRRGERGLSAGGSRAGVPSAPPTPERRGPSCARGAAPAPGPARDGGEGPAGGSRAPLTCGRAARSRGRSARSRRRARARAAAGDAIFARNPRGRAGGGEAGCAGGRGRGAGGRRPGAPRGRRGGRGGGARAGPTLRPPRPCHVRSAECVAQGRGRPVGEPLAPLRGARSPRSPGSGPEAPRPPVPSGGCRGCSCEQKRVPSLRPWGSHRPGPRTRAVSPRAGLADLPRPRPGTSACRGCPARRRGRA